MQQRSTWGNSYPRRPFISKSHSQKLIFKESNETATMGIHVEYQTDVATEGERTRTTQRKREKG